MKKSELVEIFRLNDWSADSFVPDGCSRVDCDEGQQPPPSNTVNTSMRYVIIVIEIRWGRPPKILELPLIQLK
jgi:hypothetical protein